MRSLWTIIVTMAVANLLAVLGFAGWLVASERLDEERVREIAKLLRETAPEREARLEQEAAEREALEKALEQANQDERLPMTTEERLDVLSGFEDISRQEVARLQEETRMLRESLQDDRAALEERIAEFEAEGKAFRKMRERIAEREGSEQFRKTLKIYESIDAEQARDMMATLLDEGNREQVVAYLDAMNSRQATGIIEAFRERDPALAAGLLESLRTHGVTSVDPEGQ